MIKNKTADVIVMIIKYMRNKKGFSLVEVLLSSVLLIIVFTGFINVFQYGVNMRINSRSRLQSILTAQACLEEIRGVRGEGTDEWSDINELKEWIVDFKGYTENGEGIYTKDNVTITLMGSNPEIPDKLIPIKVVVSYKDQMNKGKERTVKLETRLREF